MKVCMRFNMHTNTEKREIENDESESAVIPCVLDVFHFIWICWGRSWCVAISQHGTMHNDVYCMHCVGTHDENNKRVFILTPLKHLSQSVEASWSTATKNNGVVWFFDGLRQTKLAYWPYKNDAFAPAKTFGTTASKLTSWVFSNIHTIGAFRLRLRILFIYERIECVVLRINRIQRVCYVVGEIASKEAGDSVCVVRLTITCIQHVQCYLFKN